MSNSWRITTQLDNRSQKSLPSAGSGTGATVIRAERSLEKPVLFARGETQRMLSLLGEPTKHNPELLEAIEYNKSYPLWVASPSSKGLHSVFVFNAQGFKAVTDGFRGAEPVSSLKLVTLYTTLTQMEEGGKTFVADTDTWVSEYIIGSMKLLKNGEEIAGITNNADVFTGTPLALEEVSKYDKTLNSIEIVFADSFEMVAGDQISVSFSVDLSDHYGMLTTVGAGSAYVRAMMESQDNGVFTLQFQNKNSFGVYSKNNTSPVEFSIVPGATNGFGQNIDISSVFHNHDFFVAHANDGADFTTFTEGTTMETPSGGHRDMTDVDMMTGYGFFKHFRSYSADVFFDATLLEGIPALMKELRDGYQKYSRFLLPMANKPELEVLEEVLGVQDRGFSYYWGWFEISNPYSKKGNVVHIPMGEIAKKHADSITLSFGGLAVAWIDENGVGGQLTSGRFVRSIYDPSEDMLKKLDEARINPIIYDPSYGAMIVSRRTSVAELSDYSFTDYSGIVDYILKNVTTQVLPFQIVKMNDTIHRNIVRMKAEAILQPMTVAPLNVVDSYFIKCDSENNNEAVKAREDFRLDMAVKVTPKSRTLTFSFINTPQTSSVEVMFS